MAEIWLVKEMHLGPLVLKNITELFLGCPRESPKNLRVDFRNGKTQNLSIAVVFTHKKGDWVGVSFMLINLS